MRYKKFIAVIVLLSLIILYFYKVVFLGRVLSPADNLFSYPPYNTIAPLGWTHASNPLLGDPTSQFYPFLYYARENIRHGHLPLWNPYIMMGTPFLADAQSAVLYPINLVFYTLPFKDAFAISAFIRLFIAGFGMYIFIDALGMEFMAALFSGIIFMFCSAIIGWLSFPHTNVAVFLPWLLFLIYKFMSTKKKDYVAGLALITGIQFLGGHPETSAHILLAAALYAMALAIWEYKDKRHTVDALKNITFIAIAFIFGFMIASPMLLPFLSELAKSATWIYRSSPNAFYSSYKVFLAILMPNMVGTHIYDNFLGVKDFNTMQSNYIGIIPLILAGIAVMRRYKDRHVLFFTIFSLVLLPIIYGIPPFFQIFNLLPFYNHMTTYGLGMIFQFNMIVLAGIGFDILAKLQPEQHEISAQKNSRKQKKNTVKPETIQTIQFKSIKKISYMVIGSIVLVAIICIILINRYTEAGSLENLIERFYILCLIAGLFIISLHFYQSLRYKKSALILVILIAFFNLFYFGHDFNPQIPKDWVYPQTPKVISFMQSTKTLFRFIGIGSCYLTNTLMVYNISDVRGYDLPTKKRYDKFFTTLFHQKPFEYPSSGSYLIMSPIDKSNENIFTFTKKIVDILRLINVKFIGTITDEVYILDSYRQRAYLVHHIIPASTSDQALGLVSSNIDALLKDSAVIKEKSNAIQIPDCIYGTNADIVSVTLYQPDTVKLTTFSPCKSVLVLSDTYDSGWKASVDGHNTTILHANYLFRGVVLEPGMHEVVFTYKPISFIIGLLLSFSAIVVVIALFVYEKKEKNTPNKGLAGYD